VSIIETHYLESLLLYQDEFDRHSMSLWGVNERKKPDAHERAVDDLKGLVGDKSSRDI
jgi:hypothetical protein